MIYVCLSHFQKMRLYQDLVQDASVELECVRLNSSYCRHVVVRFRFPIFKYLHPSIKCQYFIISLNGISNDDVLTNTGVHILFNLNEL